MTVARVVIALLLGLATLPMAKHPALAEDYAITTATTVLVPNVAGAPALLDGLSDDSKTAFDDLGLTVVRGTFSQPQIDAFSAVGGSVAPAFEVGLFNGPDCGEPADVTVAEVPPHVCRLVGATPADQSGNTRRVWILDSGVDAVAVSKSLLNVTGRIDCFPAPCVDHTADTGTPAETAMQDHIGHGTMVAGIVGGRFSPSVGVSGVSPGARLIIVKIFDKTAKVNFWEQPVRALRWVDQHATPGDIVNISWGTEWSAAARKRNLDGLSLIDKVLHALADRQIRVVLAAGNGSANDTTGPWVQSIVPASSGSYVSQVLHTSAPAGSIDTVVAAVSTPAGTAWTDTVWPWSAWGDKPPSFAEPGASIEFLWFTGGGVNARKNTCSGTSFAAPALAGLYLQAPAPTASSVTDSHGYSYPLGFLNAGSWVPGPPPKCS